MEHAANRAPMSHEMSTKNRGRIVSQFRGPRGWPPGNAGLRGSNASEEPADFTSGSHGDVGTMDCDNAFQDYPDTYDGGRSDC